MSLRYAVRMCGTCVAVGEASNAPVVYALAFSAVAATGWTRLKGRLKPRQLKLSDSDSGDEPFESEQEAGDIEDHAEPTRSMLSR